MLVIRWSLLLPYPVWCETSTRCSLWRDWLVFIVVVIWFCWRWIIRGNIVSSRRCVVDMFRWEWLSLLDWVIWRVVSRWWVWRTVPVIIMIVIVSWRWSMVVVIVVRRSSGYWSTRGRYNIILWCCCARWYSIWIMSKSPSHMCHGGHWASGLPIIWLPRWLTIVSPRP